MCASVLASMFTVCVCVGPVKTVECSILVEGYSLVFAVCVQAALNPLLGMLLLSCEG